ncbi:TetR/AcrR family transcriptional regulator [Actinokineospora guangxiensis]|uniref:TetR/AcrR family transcriptional regulator n=1 Tax=Actinokineospora guangxiensis TaxID=1490288 RepID=A0ABW0ESV9_9PSEU
MTELPGYLAAAWGKQGKPTRGPKPALSLERVIAAGVSVADAEGIEGLSMSRVATELGTKPMSLYRYISSKDELIALMLDRAGGPPPPMTAEDWRSGLELWSRSYLATLRAHPWIMRVPITGPPATPNQLRWMEAGLRLATGFAPGDAMAVLLLLSGYVRSWATLSADLESANADPETMMVDYGAVLDAVVTESEFPELTKAIRAGVFTFDPDEDPDVDFVFGLERILDGAESVRSD